MLVLSHHNQGGGQTDDGRDETEQLRPVGKPDEVPPHGVQLVRQMSRGLIHIHPADPHHTQQHDDADRQKPSGYPVENEIGSCDLEEWWHLEWLLGEKGRHSVLSMLEDDGRSCLSSCRLKNDVRNYTVTHLD